MKGKDCIIMLATLLAVCSCTYKDLCYDHPHTPTLQVRYIWDRAPGASPAWMELWLYDESGRVAMHRQTAGSSGGEIHLQPGTYSALCYSGDDATVMAEGTDGSTSFLLTSHEYQPRELYTAHLDSIDVRPGEDKVIEMHPTRAVMEVVVRILGVTSLKGTGGMSAALTSLSSGIYPMREELSGKEVTLLSQPLMSDSSSMETVFRSYGYRPGMTHEFILAVSLADGSQVTYRWDVSGKMDEEREDPYRVEIVIHGLDLPQDMAEGGNAFLPLVDGWQEEHIEVTASAHQ